MSSKKVISNEKIQELVNDYRVIVHMGRRVYDVTDFCEDHPGGEELITDLNNKDIKNVMADENGHMHSDTAYEILEDYFLGVRETSSEENADDENGDSEDKLNAVTDANRDFEENKFIDLNKPLLMQVIRAKWTKEFYLEQVHKPRHYGKGSAPIFGNFLEPLSLTPWYVVPLVWVPFNLWLVSVCLAQLSVPSVLAYYVGGLFLWTLVEYLMHRFLFHLDEYLPDNQWAFTVHFLTHGVHHYLPMDRMRLVMPPALFVVLCTPLYHLCHFVFRSYYPSLNIFTGAHMGYILYDCTHYFLHHKQLPEIMKPTKVHHLDHHYKNFDLGFGVTSSFWDHVFGTTMVDTSKL